MAELRCAVSVKYIPDFEDSPKKKNIKYPVSNL